MEESFLGEHRMSNATLTFYHIYLTCSFVLLTRTNHLVSNVCPSYRDVVATALLVSNDRNLNLLQWSRGGQGHCGRESGLLNQWTH